MSDGFGLGDGIMCVLYIVVPASVIGFTIWGARRMRRASEAAISDDECVACGSKQLSAVGEGAYRCLECGYEGGSGLKQIQEDAHRASIEAMGPEQRRQSGISDLRQARALLTGCQGTLKNALRLSTIDVIGANSDRGQAKLNELTSAAGEMARAQQHIVDASLKLGESAGDGEDLDIDFNSAAFGLDVVLDNVIADFMVHGKIKETAKRADAMLAAVEAALEKFD